ncbi:energy transducer TonB [bacterium]|nr:energy transducer TonB [bacterium]
MPIQVDIPAGHVLTLDQEISGVFPDGLARRGSPFSISDCYGWELRIVDRKDVRAIPWHHWPGLDTWPPDAYETGISGNAVVRFDYLPHRDPMNVTVVREDSPGWGFADSAVAAVERTEYEFLDKSYSYAPYRVWMTARFPRDSLPWENIVRGLQYNRQLVLEVIDYPDSLRDFQDEKPQMETRFGRIPDYWLYLESDLKDLNIFCPDSRVIFYPLTDTSVVLQFGYDATDLRLRASNGLSFHRFVGGQQGRTVQAYRIMSSFSPGIDTMSAESTRIGRFARDHLSWMGVPLFEFPADSTGKGVAIFNPAPVINDHWHGIELVRQARIYSGNTTNQRVRGYAELDLVIEHDFSSTEPGDSVFFEIKEFSTHKVDPPESGFEDVAEYYMSHLQWFFDPGMVQVWRSMPTEFHPVSPDTIRHKVKIPLFGDISQPIRNPHAKQADDVEDH